MIIWINGAFGSGKTQTAYELHRRTKTDSYVYDPEEAGFFIRKRIPKAISKSDFQDYPMWREINLSMLAYLGKNYKGTVIVPMTLVNPQYFQEIVSKLRANDIDVHHYSLIASKERILERLRSRREGPNSWAAAQIDRCVVALADPMFGEHIDTERMSVEDNVRYIAERSGLELLPDTRSGFRKKWDRIATQVKHIRW